MIAVPSVLVEEDEMVGRLSVDALDDLEEDLHGCAWAALPNGIELLDVDLDGRDWHSGLRPLSD